MTLEVVEPGLLTTIQDAGRPDWTHLGVPVGGAADPWSLAVANLLVGADAGAPALELTIVGPELAVREATVIGLAGADLGGLVRQTGRRLLPGRSHPLDAGSTIAFPGGDAGTGARAYVALPGGIDVPRELGSASTLVSAGLGGVEGRALRAGDVLRAAVAPSTARTDCAWPWIDGDPLAGPPGTRPIRIVAGPAPGADVLAAGNWQVRLDSDRVGLRLEPEPGNAPLPGSGELLTHGVVRGSVQLAPGGTPMILLADHQTTGGYPVAAVVARADHPRLGQLLPGDTVRFTIVSPDEARAAWLEQEAALARGAAALGGGDAWDDLWQSAGR